jgi:hypothetical protein
MHIVINQSHKRRENAKLINWLSFLDSLSYNFLNPLGKNWIMYSKWELFELTAARVNKVNWILYMARPRAVSSHPAPPVRSSLPVGRWSSWTVQIPELTLKLEGAWWRGVQRTLHRWSECFQPYSKFYKGQESRSSVVIAKTWEWFLSYGSYLSGTWKWNCLYWTLSTRYECRVSALWISGGFLVKFWDSFGVPEILSLTWSPSAQQNECPFNQSSCSLNFKAIAMRGVFRGTHLFSPYRNAFRQGIAFFLSTFGSLIRSQSLHFEFNLESRVYGLGHPSLRAIISHTTGMHEFREGISFFSTFRSLIRSESALWIQFRV